MIHEIKIISKWKNDTKGDSLLEDVKKTLKIESIKKIKTAKVYRLEGVTKKEAKEIADKILFEPINQQLLIGKDIFNKVNQKIEIAYKPGVMNPEVSSIIKSAKDIGIKIKAADTSTEYVFIGNITKVQLQTIIKKLLINETIEHVVTAAPKTLLISGKSHSVQKIPIRNMTNNQLMDLSKDRLFLNLEEMKIIQNYFTKFKRDPTDCEIEVLAQTWSEHCIHKTFKAKLVIDGREKPPLFQRIKKTASFNKKIIVSAFVDNSGAIGFYDGFAINGKVETHNSPSAIEPYGGAMTGSGGVFRDILGTGQGAKIIASTDIFCLAPYSLPADEIPLGCLPPEYILRKVVAGVRDYGNRVGIPTNNGSLHFHKDFRAKPTVAVGSYGIVPKKNARKKQPKTGDLIIVIGGKTGRDGIHGATFSSGEMTDRTINISGTAVQIGNAIEEKRVIDAVLMLRKQNLIRTITDCGAGGLSSAIGEMGESTGARVFLEKVPLKYSGLDPWEIFLSESQERMVLAIDPKKLKEVLKVCNLYNVEAAMVGVFGSKKRLHVTYRSQLVCDLEMKFLHEGLPQRKLHGNSVSKLEKESVPSFNFKKLHKNWENIMAHGNVCSKEPIVRQYDHNVQGSNALHPFGGVDYDAPNDGAIVKPFLAKKYGVAITHGLNPTLNKIDPYWGSIWALVEAVSNYVSIGASYKEAALIDNFIWPFPDEESLAELDKSVDACVEVAKILKMPFVSGKDSLSSTYRYPNGEILKIPPVLLISVFGRIPDVTKTSSSDFKSSESKIILVGEMDTTSLGGSTYFDIVGAKSAKIPKTNLKTLTKVLDSIHLGIKKDSIMSCHDISEGGLASALSEMCFGGGVGAEIDIEKIARGREDYILFNETAGTFLVEVKDVKIAKKIFKHVPFKIIGSTNSSNKITVTKNKNKVLSLSINKLKLAWQKPMKEVFHK